jgi:hypothetical protein
MNHHFGPNIAASTWPVVDDKRLAKTLGEPLTEQPRENVSAASANGTIMRTGLMG